MSEQLFVSNRDLNLGTKLGHSILFKKGVPTPAPREIHHLLVERGILPVDDKGEVITEKVADLTDESGPKLLVAPEDGRVRMEAITKAMKAIVKRNNAKDFAANTPAAHAVSDLLGWRVDQKEVRLAWEKNRASILGQAKE